EVELRGVRIPAGQSVWLILGAANRDPEVFPEPDRFDVGRHPHRHLAFGESIHFCPGAPLARLEGQTAFAGFVRPLPERRLAPDRPEYRTSLPNRGLITLPVTFRVHTAHSAGTRE